MVFGSGILGFGGNFGFWVREAMSRLAMSRLAMSSMAMSRAVNEQGGHEQGGHEQGGHFWIEICIWVEKVSTTDSDRGRLVSPLRVPHTGDEV